MEDGDVQELPKLSDFLDREDLVEWRNLVEMHELTHIYNDKGRDGTVLFPVNGAVSNSPFWNEVIYRTSAEYSLHRNHVLLLHVIDTGEGLDSSDFFQNQQLRTAAKESITVELSESSIVGFRGLGDTEIAGHVFVSDLIALNGVGHVIDKVLLPDFWRKNVVQLMESRPGLSIFASYFREMQQLVAAATSSAAVTMLIPTNQAFLDLGPGAIELLMNDLILVESIAANHFIAHKVAAIEELEFLQPLKVFSNENLVVTVGGSGSLEDSLRVNDTSILEANILANNGLVHIIDAVLLTEEQKLVLSIDEPRESGSSSAIPSTGMATETPTMMIPATLPPTLPTTNTPPTSAPVPAIRSPNDNPTMASTTTAPTIEKLEEPSPSTTTVPSTIVPTQSPLAALSPTIDPSGSSTSNVMTFPVGPIVGGALGALLIVCITILIGLRMWTAHRPSEPSSTDTSPAYSNPIVAVPVGPEVAAVPWISGTDNNAESNLVDHADKKPPARKIANLQYKHQA